MCVPHNTHNIKIGGKVLDGGNLLNLKYSAKPLVDVHMRTFKIRA